MSETVTSSSEYSRSFPRYGVLDQLWRDGASVIHENRDYMLGNTRILNNAFGYPTPNGAEAVGFRGELVVEP
jgi:hypothetical protein